MRNRTIQILKSCLSLLFFYFLASCGSSLDVVYDYDSSVDFAEYKTFRFGNVNMDPEKISDIDRKRIVVAVAEDLIAKGYTHDTSNPDIIVHLIGKTKYVKEYTGTTTNSVSYGNNYGYYGGYPNYGYGYGYRGGYRYPYNPGYGYNSGFGVTSTTTTSTPTYDEYTDGTLIIDIVDSKGGNIVWQGIGTKKIYEASRSSEESDERARVAISSIMISYPPGVTEEE